LDIFHAVQRIVKTIPKGTVESYNLAREVRLVFRKDGDIGEDRISLLQIMNALIIILSSYFFKWKGKLSRATLRAIENLQVHMHNVCLSGIPPSAGTTLNERHLKRSSVIFPELAVPILALPLYVWTCRWRGLKKHANNQRLKPEISFEFGDLKETLTFRL